MKKVTNSRKFAVVLTFGTELGVYFVHKRTEVAGNNVDGHETKAHLEVSSTKLPWPVIDRDKVIELLKKAGLTVRFFDREESQWMDDSISHGYVRAPGNRDGTWGVPASLEEFEEKYLQSL